MPFSKKNKSRIKTTDKIFVSIPSYRDIECKNTIHDLFSKAKNPHNIVAGVLTQNNPEVREEDCGLSHELGYNIRSKNIDYRDANGPLMARSIIARDLFRDEKYFLTIDSHTKFVQDWDTKLIHQLQYLMSNGVKKPILTNYIPDVNLMKGYDRVPHICDILEIKEIPYIFQNNSSVPKNTFAPAYFIGAGGMFTLGSYVKDIGLDCLHQLNYLQNGEEILYSILAYSHGYDQYTPADNLIFHMYETPNRPHFRNDLDKHDLSKSGLNKIVGFLIRGENPEGIFNLGSERTIKSYWDIIGFDTDEPDDNKKWNSEKAKRLCNPTNVIKYEV